MQLHVVFSFVIQAIKHSEKLIIKMLEQTIVSHTANPIQTTHCIMREENVEFQ